MLDDLRALLDRIETQRARAVAGVLRSHYVPGGSAYVLQTTRGAYLVLSADDLAALARGAGAGALRAVFGIPVLDALPEDAELRFRS